MPNNTGKVVGTVGGTAIAGPVGGFVGGIAGGLLSGGHTANHDAANDAIWSRLPNWAKGKISQESFRGIAEGDAQYIITNINAFSARGSGTMIAESGTQDATLQWATDRSVYPSNMSPVIVGMMMRITQAFYDYKFGSISGGENAGNGGSSSGMSGQITAGTDKVIATAKRNNYLLIAGVVLAVVVIIVLAMKHK